MFFLSAATPQSEAQSSPSITIQPNVPSITEGENAIFTVRRSGDDTHELTVNYRTVNGPAIAVSGFAEAESGSDYTATSGSITFPAGSSQSQTFSVKTLTDSTYEPREHFHIKANFTYNDGDNSISGSVPDSPDQKIVEKEQRYITFSPLLSSNPYLEFETEEGGNGGKNVLTLTLNESLPHGLRINYTVGSSPYRTATKGIDYTMADSNVTIPAGRTSATININITDDTRREPDEFFTMSFAFDHGSFSTNDGTYKTVLFKDGKSTLSVVIKDNDNDKMGAVYLRGEGRFPVGNSAFPTTRRTLKEGEKTTITAEIAGDAPSADIKIPLKFTGYPKDEVTSADYDIPDSITIKGGQTSGSVMLTIKKDTADERFQELLVVEIDETKMEFPSASYDKGDRSKFEVVMEDVEKTEVTLKGLDKMELSEDSGNRTAIFEIEMRSPKTTASGKAPFSDVDVAEDLPEFNLSYSGKTKRAIRGSDYISPESVSGSGQGCSRTSSKLTCTVKLKVTDDDLYEGGDGSIENITISLAGGAFNGGLKPTGSSLSLTIEDNDIQPMFSINKNISVTEGEKTSFQVTRSGAMENRISVVARTDRHDDGTHLATEGTDYTAFSNRRLFLDKNQMSRTFEMVTKEDVIDEPDETFLIILSNPRDEDNEPVPGIKDDMDTATVTITDDDDAPTNISISVDKDSVAESAEATDIAVTAEITSSTLFAESKIVTVTVGNTGEDDSAISGTDYKPVSSFDIIIPTAQRSASKTFKLEPIDDAVDEDTEKISVAGTSSDVTVAGTTISITDNDTRGITVTPAALTLNEVDNSETGDTEENKDTYNVVLTSEPTDEVRVNVVSKDEKVVTIDSSNLTFDKNNWKTPKTVTVTAVNDPIDNINNRRTTTIAHTVSADGTDYEDETAEDVQITVTDDDEAPTSLTVTVDKSKVSEGDKDTVVRVTATLDGDTRFATDKTITVTVGDADDDTATEGSGGDYETVVDIDIELPAGEESAYKDFTLTLNNDDFDEPDEEISVTGSLSGVTVTDTSITIEDNDDTPTVTLVLTPPSINESGATNASTITATMDGKSSKPVTLKVSADPVAPTVTGDFTLSDNKTLTIPALSKTSTGVVTITAADNDVHAADKTVTVSATADGGNDVVEAPQSVTLTIKNEDTRGIEIKPTALTLHEADDTETSGTRENESTYTVVLTSQPTGTGTVTININDVDSVATANPASLTFNSTDWSTEQKVTVTAVPDEIDNTNDRRTANISHTVSAVGTDYAGETAVDVAVTVNDDDGAPTLSINSPSVEEGHRATATLTFTVRLTPRSEKVVTVAYADAGSGDAVSGTDYAALSEGTITFSPGDTSETVSVTVNGDLIDEPDETVVVRLSSPTNARLTGGENTLDGTGTITDDDPTPTVSVSDAAAVTEGNVTTPDPPNNMTFRLELSAASGQTVTVPYTLGGTAIAGTDYTEPSSRSVMISPGQTHADITVPVKGDEIDEENKTVTVTLGMPTNATVSTAEGAGTATGTITDDDTRGISVQPVTLTLEETDDTGTGTEEENKDTYDVVLTSEPTGTVTVSLRSRDETVATINTASLSFNSSNWDIPRTVTVTAVPDVIDNTNDRRTVNISHTVSAAGTDYAGETANSVAVTVNDDDAAPTGITLTVDNATVSEDAGNTTITVRASVNGSTRYVDAKTVTVSVNDDTATSPADYAAVTNFDIVIAAGAASNTGSFSLAPVNDNLDEDDETIDVTGSTSDALRVTGTEVTIADQDDPPSFSISGGEADEGGAIRFTITRSGASGNAVSVKIATATDTDGGVNAADSDDYTAITAPQTISFPGGDTSKTVDVPTTQDDLYEDDETFLAVLSDPAVADGDPATEVSIAEDGGTAKGTIKNEDVEPSFAVTNASASEGEAIIFTVTRSGAQDNEVSVKWNTKPATGANAASSTDYTEVPTATKLDFGSGVRSVNFTVTTTEDVLDEGNETFLVELTDAKGGVIGTAEATGTINDDDAAPNTITIEVDTNAGGAGTPTTIGEGAGSTTVRITARITSSTRFATEQTVAVVVGKAMDSATEGTDYGAVADQDIKIPVGAQSAYVDVSITPTDDDLDEPDETITVEGDLSGVTVTPAVITINDDEGLPTVTLELGSASIDESGGSNSTAVTARLSGRSSEAVTLTVAAAPGADTASGDFTLSANTTLTIAAGSLTSSGTVTITAVDNNIDAPNKTVTVSATASGGGVNNPADQTLTINDDDAAPGRITLSVNPTSVAESAGRTGITVTASVNGTTLFADSKTVTVSVGGGTATSSTDYAAVSNFSIVIAAGAASNTGTFNLTPTQDSVAEGNETINVTGTAPGVATVTAATVTITDDDAAPTALTLTVDADTATNNVQSSIAENGGAKTVRIIATLVGTARFVAAKTVTVEVGKSADSATEGTDYATVGTQTITIAAGEGSGYVDFTLTPTDDNLDEEDETISFDGTSTGLTVTHASITITDDDDASPTDLTISVDTDSNTNGKQNSVTESGGAKTVTVTATFDGTARFAVNKSVTVSVGKSSDTAVEGADYQTVVDFNITINAGAASGSQTFTLTPIDNAIDEQDKTISVEGTSTELTVTPDEITVTDDDTTPTALTLSVDADTGENGVQESLMENGGAKTVRVTATLGGSSRFATDKTVTVEVGKEGDSANEGKDYEPVDTQTITIAAGARSGSKTFTLTPIDNAIDEEDKSISVEGILKGVTVTNAIITIEDNDTTPELSITSSSVTEGDDPGSTVALNFTVTMDVASGQRVVVPYADAGTGTATSGKDYEPLAPGTLIFTEGSTINTVTVAVKGDRINEYDETVVIRFSSPTNATFLDGAQTLEVTGTIEDDDNPAILSINSPSVRESGTSGVAAAMTFTVTLTPESSKVVTVSYANPETGTATPDRDYVPISPGTLTFSPGVTSRTITVTVNGDSLDEYDETVALRLSNPTNASFPDNVSTLDTTGLIIDNNDPPTVSFADSDPVEEGTVAVFPLNLSEESGKTITVRWATSSGTALEDVDYHGSGAEITINPGTTSETIEVATIDDREIEFTENFSVTLSDPVNLTLEKSTAIGTIEDDDRPKAIARLKRVNKTILPYVSSALMRSRIDHITGCINHAASGVSYGDLSSLEGQLRNNAETWEQDPMERVSFRDVFSDARLATMFKSYGETHNPGDVTFCAGSDWNELSGGEGDLIKWDGSLGGAHVGGNVRLSEWILTGLDLFLYTGSFDWTDSVIGETFTGDWDLDLRGVNPYVALLSEDGETQFWAMAGYGFGKVSIVEEEILDQSADITMKSMALGGAVPLRKISDNGSLSLRGDLWLGEFEIADNADLIRGVSVQTRGGRALLESKWQGSSVTPSLLVGVKHDNASSDSTGMEIGSGIEWESRSHGLRASLKSRALLVRSSVQEWGISGDVQLSPRRGLGPSLRLATSRGESEERASTFFENDSETEFGEGGDEGMSLEAEAGWGIPAVGGRGVMTPFAAVWLLERDESVLRLGGRLDVGKAFDLQLEGQREKNDVNGSEYELLLEAKFSF